MSQRRLLELADEVRSIAMTGLHYSENSFDRDRYERLLKIAAATAGLGARELDSTSIESIYRSADLGYVTPKVDVRMGVFRGDEVLLVREKIDGLWCMPGGYAEVGDPPSESAARETLEEAGVEVRPTGLAGVFDYRLQPSAPPHVFHIYKLVFVGELIDPNAQPSGGNETSDAAFHPLDALPELSMGRTLGIHIDAARRTALDPGARPHFD
jgi:8-oxo-dGTP pyrophosphatase MutT (NUDIX family)